MSFGIVAQGAFGAICSAMDINETLKRLRALLGGDHSGEEDDDAATLDFVCEAEELFQALDQWLSGGGFLPKEWERR